MDARQRLSLPALPFLVSLLAAAPRPAAAADVFEELGRAAKDAGRKIKKTVKKVKKKVQKAGREVEEEVDEVVEEVVDGSGKVITDGARKTTRVVLLGRKELEKVFSKDTVDDIAEALDDAMKGAQRNAMWSAIVAKIKEQRPAAERTAKDTKAFVRQVDKYGRQFKDDFNGIYALVKHLVTNEAASQRMGELFVRVAKLQFGKRTDELAQWLAGELTERLPRGERRAAAAGWLHRVADKPAASPIPPAIPYPVRSVAVTLGWNFGGHIGVAGGWEGRFGVIFDVDAKRKVSDVRVVYTLAEGLGVGVGATGAGIDLGVSLMVQMAALPTRNASGLFFGPNGSAGAIISGNVGLDWGWAGGQIVPAPIPSVAAGPGITDPDPSAGVLVMIGYAVTANGDGFDHGIPGVPAK